MQTADEFEYSEKMLFKQFEINETYDPTKDDLIKEIIDHRLFLLRIIKLGNDACQGRSEYFRNSLERNNFTI